MTDKISEGVIVKIVNVNWDYLRTKFSAAEWDRFVEDCQKALAEHVQLQDTNKLEAEIEASLGKSAEGKLILQLFKNTLEAAGMRFSKNAPKDSHPTDAVQNSVDELAERVKKAKSADGTSGDSQNNPSKNK